MADYAVVINRTTQDSLSTIFSPLVTAGAVDIHFICTHKGTEVLQLWKNGHAYRLSISKNGQSVTIVADNGKR